MHRFDYECVESLRAFPTDLLFLILVLLIALSDSSIFSICGVLSIMGPFFLSVVIAFRFLRSRFGSCANDCGVS